MTDARQLASALQRPEAYRSCPAEARVVVHETHVSWVFLAGDHAYKVKKPIVTGFLDYGSLEQREHFCHQEVRLNRRYAPDLYLDVVPITRDEQGAIRVEGSETPIEWAVKMQRFPEDALLSQRLEAGKIADDEIIQLAKTVAQFHQSADRADLQQPWGSPEVILQEAIDNVTDLRSMFAAEPPDGHFPDRLDRIQTWTETAFERHRASFQQRRDAGFIRECHGDLHLANVIRWHGQWTPFDGIEFNEEFRWIDVLSDAAFLAMDFAAKGHFDLERSFVSAYLEQTGDYQAMPLLRWYLVYRAMVRAKVAAIRAQQPGQSPQAQTSERQECLDHLALADRFTELPPPHLWITHGVSGSGKTTGTDSLIQQQGAVRLRSDVERKRLFELAPSQRPEGDVQQQVYSDQATEQTYGRLHDLARMLLRSGESVVVDATFLKQRYRDLFRQLAREERAGFAILPFHADPSELERRIALRMQHDRDASDANLQVLRQQLQSIEPLTEQEQSVVQSPPGSSNRADLQSEQSW